MTRIVGGAARGRRLVVPHSGTRPTSDRAREAVFSSIESMRGSWVGATVLDLYAGSGAFGLEALSRGAIRADLVESDRAAVKALTTNVSAVRGAPVAGENSSAHVHRADASVWVGRPPSGVTYDVVFCDPPYAEPSERVAAALSRLVDVGALRAQALLVVERSARDDAWLWPADLRGVWDRRYGEAHLWIAQYW